jgi:hypothetical protein
MQRTSPRGVCGSCGDDSAIAGLKQEAEEDLTLRPVVLDRRFHA